LVKSKIPANLVCKAEIYSSVKNSPVLKDYNALSASSLAVSSSTVIETPFLTSKYF
jgi:hypothetical protein